MKAFFDASAFLKVSKKEENYRKVVEWLEEVSRNEHDSMILHY